MDSKQFEDFVSQDYASLADWLFSLNAYEFSLIATAIGFAISPSLTVNQQNSLGNFFELIGQVILTINAQNTTLAQAKAKTPGIKPYFETQSLEEEILKIKQEVIQVRKDCLSNQKGV